MNRTLILVSALGAGLMTVAGVAQTTDAPASQPTTTQPARPAAVAPHAVPAKIALIAYEQVAAATNEGQRAIQEIQTKYAPKKAQIDSLSGEVDSLKKQAQSAPATESDEARATRNRSIDTKEKQLQRDAEDAQTAYNTDLQEALGKVAQKLGPTVIKYVQENGYTLLLDISGQQGGVSVLWAAPGTDISQAIITAYNASSGVAAPVPSAPTPGAAARPRSTTPRTPATKK